MNNNANIHSPNFRGCATSRGIRRILVVAVLLTSLGGGLAAQIPVLPADSAALVSLYNTSGGTGWTGADNWLAGPVSTWEGVTIMSGRVSFLSLPNKNLTGTLPPELTELTALTGMNLAGNNLDGNIPAFLGQIITLEWLQLQSNQYTGPIPPELGDLINLEQLWLNANQLTGKIPASLGRLRKLRNLFLYGNQLTGSIPPELGNDTSLVSLQLFDNRLSGSIPAELGQLKKLTGFFAHTNQLVGTLPATLGNLTELRDLILYNNKITDPLPASLAGLVNLLRLNLSGNLIADLPDLSTLPLSMFRVDGNRLTYDDLEPYVDFLLDPSVNFVYHSQVRIPTMQGIQPDGSVIISVFVGGDPATTYQWIGDGTVVVGATNSEYALSVSEASMGGKYYCLTENKFWPGLDIRSHEVRVCPFPDTVWVPRDDIGNTLPPGVRPSIRIFGNCAASAWLVRATPSDGDWSFRAVLSEPFGTVSSIAQANNAFIGLNGGFFDATRSVSLVASGGSILRPNIETIQRDGQDFYPTRATFLVNEIGLTDFAWTYNVRNLDATRTVYKYPAPSENSPGDRKPQPTDDYPGGGSTWWVQEAIGGGPMLVMGGAPVVDSTLGWEVFFGNAGQQGPIGNVGTRDPRTAMGMTAAGEYVFIVADGRCADGSKAVNGRCDDGDTVRRGTSHLEMADMFVRLGATAGMNLDGGGSSTLVVDGIVVNKPSDGGERRVASTILLVPSSTQTARALDAGSGCCYREDGIWTVSPGAPYYGTTPARINETGTGVDRAVWTLSDITPGSYEVSAWWVPGADRATNTPFKIYHSAAVNGMEVSHKLRIDTTIRVDQSDSTTAGVWNVLGTFDLTPGDSIVVTDEATGSVSPAYVVVDAVLLTANTPTGTVDASTEPVSFSLAQNYPNPFNPSTKINYSIPTAGMVRLRIYDILGRLVATLVEERKDIGEHVIVWDASGMASGIYFYRIVAGEFTETRKMGLMK